MLPWRRLWRAMGVATALEVPCVSSAPGGALGPGAYCMSRPHARVREYTPGFYNDPSVTHDMLLGLRMRQSQSIFFPCMRSLCNDEPNVIANTTVLGNTANFGGGLVSRARCTSGHTPHARAHHLWGTLNPKPLLLDTPLCLFSLCTVCRL